MEPHVGPRSAGLLRREAPPGLDRLALATAVRTSNARERWTKLGRWLEPQSRCETAKVPATCRPTQAGGIRVSQGSRDHSSTCRGSEPHRSACSGPGGVQDHGQRGRRLQLLRRFLAGLMMALVALLPGASHAFASVENGSALVHVGQIRHHAGGAPTDVTADRHADADCPGHHGRHVPSRKQPCKGCTTACCAPAIVGSIPPSSAATAISLLHRPPPAADRRPDDAARGEQLRPPTSL